MTTASSAERIGDLRAEADLMVEKIFAVLNSADTWSSMGSSQELGGRLKHISQSVTTVRQKVHSLSGATERAADQRDKITRLHAQINAQNEMLVSLMHDPRLNQPVDDQQISNGLQRQQAMDQS